jgi:hypothetical protein
MVMDVMAAAARIEAAGGHVIHMEVGQPAASGAEAAIAAAHAALDAGGSTTPRRSAFPRCARASPALPRDLRLRVDAERIVVTTGSSGAFILASLRCSSPAIASRSRCPAIRRIATSSPRSAASRADRDDNETRHALTGEALLACPPQDAAEGRAGRQPRQSDRHHDVARGAGEPDARGR